MPISQDGKSAILNGVTCTFKRPTLGLVLSVNEFEQGSVLFKYKDTFSALSGGGKMLEAVCAEWQKYFEMIFEEPFSGAVSLTNLVYPDDIDEVERSFFMLPWQRKVTLLQGLTEPSTDSQRG